MQFEAKKIEAVLFTHERGQELRNQIQQARIIVEGHSLSFNPNANVPTKGRPIILVKLLVYSTVSGRSGLLIHPCALLEVGQGKGIGDLGISRQFCVCVMPNGQILKEDGKQRTHLTQNWLL